MNTPPLLTGAVLIFWGWQTGLLIPGVFAAAAVESYRLTSWRIELDDSGFSRIISLCNIFLVLAVIMAYRAKGSALSFLVVIQWFPLILLPLITAQLYSKAGSINPDIFFIFLKTNKTENTGKALKTINISYPFIAICILAGSLANMRSFWSYTLMALLSGWALLSVRPTRYPLSAWLVLFFTVASMGYLGGIGLNTLHGKVEDKFIEWYAGTLTGSSNDYQRTSTAIGQLGKRKSSGRIILRVEKGSYSGSFHLAQSSYDTYRSSSWQAILAPMTPVQPEEGGATWRFGDRKNITEKISIYMQGQGKKTILPLPDGTKILEGLPAKKLSRNRLGTVEIEHDTSFVTYNISSGDDLNLKDLSEERDIAIPQKVAPFISGIADKLGLYSKTPDEVVNTLIGFFLNKFRYTLDPAALPSSAVDLEDFLLKTRSGHCEYFATSTVLLLRAAGIPARYTVGYLAHEYNKRENMFVIRDRDSHAWVRAYIDGRWQTVDTTPPSWPAADREFSSLLEPISDYWSFLQFRFSKWWTSMKSSSLYWYVIIILFLILLWRLFGKGGFSITKMAVEDAPAEPERLGMDSPFYLMEEKLKAMGIVRFTWETYPVWLKRLEDEGHPAISTNSLKEALSLHTRLRFDPMGILKVEKEDMAKLVNAWSNNLSEHEKS